MKIVTIEGEVTGKEGEGEIGGGDDYRQNHRIDGLCNEQTPHALDVVDHAPARRGGAGSRHRCCPAGPRRSPAGTEVS